MDISELFYSYLVALSRYESFIKPDPDMLAQTEEGERLEGEMLAAWDRYYEAKYPNEVEDQPAT